MTPITSGEEDVAHAFDDTGDAMDVDDEQSDLSALSDEDGDRHEPTMS